MTEEQVIARIAEALAAPDEYVTPHGYDLARKAWNEIKAITLESPATLRQPYEPETRHGNAKTIICDYTVDLPKPRKVNRTPRLREIG
ncbi:MAG: hypothetical protein ACR2RF_10395 [Geminicoccaceae bacterium]